jgi:DNA polymerase (family 10)
MANPLDLTPERIAQIFEEIALLLELKGENPFKLRAYRQGAEIVREFDGDLLARARDRELGAVKGLGSALQEKLHELATTGALEFHENLRAEFPASLFELFELQGLGPKKIKQLYETLAITSVAELEAACAAGQVAALPGFGAKSAAKILEAVALRQQFAARFLMGAVAVTTAQILDALQRHPATLRAAVAGSFRRAKETVADLDFLVATSAPAELTSWFTQMPGVTGIIGRGETKASVRLTNGLQCDLRAVSNAQFPFALQYFTGSKEHNVALRQIALKQKLSLNEYGLTPVAGSGVADPGGRIHDEADIYRVLGLDPIPPELRENRGELEAADAGTLPRLIELENLRGTFHCHTTASDGRAPLAAMVDTARDLGLQYLGISDHSKSSFQARGLDEQRLLQQLGEIRALDATLDDITLFAGSEVDILRDGSLDFDDSILAQLDFCIASVHAAFALTEEEMTRRIIKAMENEHVTMLGHLTGRLLLRRDAYPVDHAKIIDCAAETRTVIELNATITRLDMDWRWWQRARDKGVLCSINPDAHHPEHFQNLAFGVRIARKGWLRREDVINTRSPAQIQEFLRTPKAKR